MAREPTILAGARLPKRALFLALLLAVLPASAAETLLYATSIRVHIEEGGAGVECMLYRIDPATGAATMLAPVRIAGKQPISAISLAIHPVTGKVYGVTAGLTMARSLVSIDPASGNVTLIGPLGEVVSDLAFSGDGTLYGWLPSRNRLATIDLESGRAAPLGESGIAGIMGGGMAIDDRGVAYVAATGATGTLDTVDIRTGHGTTGPVLQGAPYLSAITNLTFSPAGRLYGVNSNMGSPASTALVTIDPQTGRTTEVGSLPKDAHALIFAPYHAAPPTSMWIWIVAAIAGIVAVGVVGALALRRR